ncbi:AP-1 complex subunit gamma [Entamoeba marina]
MKTFKDTPKESVKLKTLVNNLRQCKTMEDERTLITRECADIRATMVNPQFRTRNVMKLIYLHLLGYPTQFAQIECLALISSYNFQAKRIGYLALGLLMDETDETLTLVINQLQKDLQSNVQCVTELALTTIANIASEELCQVLSPLVIKTFSAPHHNVKKKAVAAAIRIIIKCPYLANEYVDPLNSLLANKSERFILSSTKLALVMINTNDILQQCQESSEHLLAVLKQNSRGTSSDVTLQGLITCHILELLQKLISKKYMIQLEDIIVDILINSPKNSVGVSVGLSAVRCAIEIDCDPIIKQMAINYLMQLLHSQFSNDRYASLRYLNEIISKCWKLVLPYKTRCIECLNDSDIGIRMLSLQLCYEFAQHGLQKEMVRDIVHYLGNDPEFTQAATRIVCDIISDVDASDVWKFEYLLQLALASGDDVGDDITQRIISVVASSSIQTYAVTKLFPLLLDTPMAVQKASIWVIW